MKLRMNLWSGKQFLSKHDEAYMRAGNDLLKKPALGLQGEPPWRTDTETQHQYRYKIKNDIVCCQTEPGLPWRDVNALSVEKKVKLKKKTVRQNIFKSMKISNQQAARLTRW